MKAKKKIAVLVVLALSVCAPMVPSASAGGGCVTIQCAVNKGLKKIPANLVQVATVVGVVNGDDQKIFYDGAVNTSPNAPKPTATTLFAIGSITKTMTATLLALYDKRGLVHIPSVPPGGPFNPRVEQRATLLQEVLPTGYNLPCPRKKITLLDLADHHSGLPKRGEDTDVTVADLYADLSSCPGCTCFGPSCSSCKPPGSYDYSNFGFLILGHVLANVVQAQTWGELNESQIMLPLEMVDTDLKERYDAQDFPGRAATGYGKNSLGQPVLPNSQGFDAIDNAAGGLWSTPDDMMRWLVYNMSPSTQPNVTSARAELLSLLPALQYPRVGGAAAGEHMGLGWQLVPVGVNSFTVIEKGGAAPGFRAYIGFAPGLKRGVFVLFNYTVDVQHVSPVGRTILENLP